MHIRSTLQPVDSTSVMRTDTVNCSSAKRVKIEQQLFLLRTLMLKRYLISFQHHTLED